MLLLWAIVLGLLAGGIRAAYHRCGLNVPNLRLIWLVPLAFFPQWLVFFWPPTRSATSIEVASLTLVGSQLLLLVFAWYNRKASGFWLLGLGLFLNLLVIALNGGLMPIAPETMIQLAPPGTPALEMFPPGSRLGTTKDVVLHREETRLWWLSDALLFPQWFPLRFAYSVGDVLIAMGILWLLWQAGRGSQVPEKFSIVPTNEAREKGDNC